MKILIRSIQTAGYNGASTLEELEKNSGIQKHAGTVHYENKLDKNIRPTDIQ